MDEPKYHLPGVMRTQDALPADFDGPLDVILLLLSKYKIEIQSVSITSITEQYLAYLEEMKRLDMEIASEFIAMASHLMLIKTKMLLSAARAAIPVYLLSRFLTAHLSRGFVNSFIVCALSSLAGLFVYALALLLTRESEITGLLKKKS